jgi:hypothetical protein
MRRISDKELDFIVEYASEASPGPWYYKSGNCQVERSFPHRNVVCDIVECNESSEEGRKRFGRTADPFVDGQYIASVSPDVVLSLIAEVREARAN